MGDPGEVAPGIFAIDTRMGGVPNATAAYLVRASEPALVETGPGTSSAAVQAGLERLGIGPSDLAHVVVTHIHLDHAGGLGAIAARYPKARVWVHERGARHVADPSRLVASAAKVYGEPRLRQLFGSVEPVPADRIEELSGDRTIPLGDRTLTALDTPGHASHHVAILDSETGVAFTGDALGVYTGTVRVLRPATPPPEFDLEQSIASIARISEAKPPALLFSHFGAAAEVAHLCALAELRLRKWSAIVERAIDDADDSRPVAERLRTETADEYAVVVERDVDLRAYEMLTPYEMNAAGLVRYHEKRRAAEAASPDPGGVSEEPRVVLTLADPLPDDGDGGAESSPSG